LIFIFHEKIEYFELPYFKIKLRNTVKEAEKIIAKLKAISIPLAKCSLTSLIATGRFNCIGKKEKFAILAETINELKSLGCETNDIIKARKSFDTVTCYDIAKPIFCGIRDVLQKKYTLYAQENNVPLNSPIKTGPISEEITRLDKLTKFTLQRKNFLSSINDFLSSSNHINEQDASEIKNKFQIDFENLKSYEDNGEFFDEDHFMNKVE
jgi:hypothetical protein